MEVDIRNTKTKQTCKQSRNNHAIQLLIGLFITFPTTVVFLKQAGNLRMTTYLSLH